MNSIEDNIDIDFIKFNVHLVDVNDDIVDRLSKKGIAKGQFVNYL
jgi:hypothetical protein